jgi:hypothetical protein
VATLPPLSPVLALTLFGRVHSLTAELFHEAVGVFWTAEAKHLVPFMLPDHSGTVFGQRQAMGPTKLRKRLAATLWTQA